ncbi:MAG: ATP-binding protein [Actinomycetota bacterium]
MRRQAEPRAGVTGGRSPKPAPHAERKLVTLLFADLTGYTALAESLDPEEVYSFVRPAIAELVRVAEDFGGTVPQVLGDGFMAVFGVPIAHEDDAERAVRAALEIRDHVRRLNAGRLGLRLPEVHSGVNSGEVMVAHADEAAGFAVIGDTVNTASRLADLAPGGHVFVGERTKELTEHAIHYGGRRLLRAKGKPRPLTVFEALSPQTRAPARRPASGMATEFVGRERALDRLASELRDVVATGRSRVLLVTGEPGLGKSRLAAHFGARVHPARVLPGRCLPYGQRRPLLALADAIRAGAGISAEATAEEADAALRRLAHRVSGGKGVRSLTRGLHLLLGTAEASVEGGSHGSVPDAALAARAVVEGLARKHPVAVVLDDLHWADPDLLQLVEDINRSPWDGPVLLLGLTRPELLEGRSLPSLELDALDEREARALVASTLGGELPQGALRRLFERAGGNPLFLEESLRMLAEAGAIIREDGAWLIADPTRLERVPGSIRLLIAERLDGLPAEEKRALQDASVSGDATWDRLVKWISDVAQPRRAIQGLVRRDLLRRRPRSQVRGAVEYGFKHSLIRDVAYDSIPRRERAARHLRIAEWLRTEWSAAEEPIAALAYHHERAWHMGRSKTGPPPDPATGRRAAEFLGRWADRTFVYQARLAEDLYRRGLRVARELRETAPWDLQARLLIGHAESLIELGRHREAAPLAAEARDLADGSADDRLAARSLLSLGRVESDVGDPSRARELLHEALTRFEVVGDIAGQAWATHRLSETWASADDRRELEHLREAYRLFTKSGDGWGRAIAAHDLAYVLTTHGGREFHRWYERSRRLTEDEGDLRARAALLRTWGYFTYYTGRYPEAIDAMRQARPIAVEAGDRYTEADTLVIEALAASTVGLPEASELLAQQVMKVSRAIESPRVHALGLVAGARSALRSGRPSLAARRLASARRIFGPRADLLEVHFAEAWVHLDRGFWDRVPESVEGAQAEARANGWKLLEPIGPLLRGQAHLGFLRLDEAFLELDRAVARAREVGADGTLAIAETVRDQAELLAGRLPAVAPRSSDANPEIEARLAENRGLRELLAGPRRAREADEAFETAVRHWRRLGVTVWLARALAISAEARRRHLGPRSGAASVREAGAVLEMLGTPSRFRDSVMAPLRGPSRS